MVWTLPRYKDNPQVRRGPLRSLLGSPSVTSHLLFRGLLVSTTVRVTQGASHRLPTHSGESPPATPMQWEHRPTGEGKHCCTGFKSSSASIPLQTVPKDDSSKVAGGRQTRAPGTGGRFRTKANWQVAHQYWLSTAKYGFGMSS